jgi:hypothetical protein
MLAISSKEAKLVHIYTFLMNHISLDSKCSIPYHCICTPREIYTIITVPLFFLLNNHNFHLVLLLMLAISSKEAKLIHIYTFLCSQRSLDSHHKVLFTWKVHGYSVVHCFAWSANSYSGVVSTVHTPRFIKEAAEFRFMISFSYWFHMHEIRSW